MQKSLKVVDRTHPELASGKPVQQKNPIYMQKQRKLYQVGQGLDELLPEPRLERCQGPEELDDLDQHPVERVQHRHHDLQPDLLT